MTELIIASIVLYLVIGGIVGRLTSVRYDNDYEVSVSIIFWPIVVLGAIWLAFIYLVRLGQ